MANLGGQSSGENAGAAEVPLASALPNTVTYIYYSLQQVGTASHAWSAPTLTLTLTLTA